MSDGNWVHPHWVPTRAGGPWFSFPCWPGAPGAPLVLTDSQGHNHPPPTAQGLANWAIGTSSQDTRLQPGARTRRPPKSELQRLRSAAVLYGRTFTAPGGSHTAQVSSGLPGGVHRSTDRSQSSPEPLGDLSSKNCLSQPVNEQRENR